MSEPGVVPPDKPTVAALVPVPVGAGSLVRPAAALEQIEEAFREYGRLCTRLLEPSDYQRIGSKDFRKKSAWRKLAVAFGVSAEIGERVYERNEQGRLVRAEVVARAIAPNGRYMDGLGACDLFERCCPNPCPKAKWNNHDCCKVGCSGSVHFSKPQHDIPATAATRAVNRACADLFGFGEVSAEEIVGDGEDPGPDAWFVANGWSDRADYAMWRADALEQLKELPAVLQDSFKRWREEEGIPNFEREHTKEQAEKISQAILKLKGAPSNPPSPDPATPPTGRATEMPTAGDSDPVDAEVVPEPAGGDGPGVGVSGGAPAPVAADTGEGPGDVDAPTSGRGPGSSPDQPEPKPARPRAKKPDAASPTPAQALRLYFTSRLPAYDRGERLDVYSAVAGRDITSGNDLDEGEMERVRDGVEGLVTGALVLAFTTAGKPVLQAREAS